MLFFTTNVSIADVSNAIKPRERKGVGKSSMHLLNPHTSLVLKHPVALKSRYCRGKMTQWTDICWITWNSTESLGNTCWACDIFACSSRKKVKINRLCFYKFKIQCQCKNCHRWAQKQTIYFIMSSQSINGKLISRTSESVNVTKTHSFAKETGHMRNNRTFPETDLIWGHDDLKTHTFCFNSALN